jgi:hypothetical protein
VPSGKTLYVLGVYYTNSLGTGLQILFGYGTAAIASEGTTTPPTGAIYYGSGNSVFVSGLSTAAAAGAYTYMPIPMSFPANSYPFVKFYGGGYAGCVLICYLQ